MTKRLFLAALICFPASICLAGASFIPLFNFNIYHSNVFYEKQSATPSINYDLDLVPALGLSDNTSLLPRLGWAYNGTLLPKQIEDQGDLYLQLTDYLAYVKLVHKTNSGFSTRAEAGSKTELTREASNEDWNSGLYNYTSNHIELSVGQQFGKPMSLNIGIRSFPTLFPNYSSLAAGTTQYLELAGNRTLDTSNSELFINYEWLISTVFLKFSINTLTSDFTDQKIVNPQSGLYEEGSRRQDKYTDFSIGLSHVLPDYKLTSDDTGGKEFKAFIGINFESVSKTSNQNHFDTEAPGGAFGEEKYYDYTQTTLSPSLTIRFVPSNTDLSIIYNSQSKKYPNRLTQDVNGNYSTTDEKVFQNSAITSIKAAFPVAQKFQAYISGDFRRNSSNMQYEKFYKYNFTAYSYAIGLSYEY